MVGKIFKRRPLFMPTNFDVQLDRRSTESIKWNLYGYDVLPMWVADMDFLSPTPIIDALEKRIKHGVFGYACEPLELKHSIQEWLALRYKWFIQEEDIVFLTGVISGFNLACKAFTQPGDGYLIQTPVYPPFFSLAENYGIACQEMELFADDTGKYVVDYDRFETTIKDNTKVFLLCNPHNPIGRTFYQSELSRMAEICLNRNVLIVSDEIHCDLIYSGNTHIPIATLDSEVSRKTITLMAPSKTFNIAGLNCAFAVIQDEQTRNIFNSARGNLVGEVNLLGQVAAQEAYRHCGSWLTELMAYLKNNRDYLYDYLRREIPQIRMSLPEATFLAWLDCRNTGISGNPYEFFLKNSNVAMNDGHHFGKGGKGFVRLNFGCPRSMLELAMTRLKEALSQANLL
jgi:cystathionine beta-lyase